jgi:methionine sulfoxide reductase catalytic subunit
MRMGRWISATHPRLCHPLPAARHIVFYAFDNKSTSEPHAQGPGYFYETIRLELAEDPQTILVYEMNGQPLPILHGTPLRLRVETQIGFTMVKYIRAIEFIHDYRVIGQGQSGWREDYSISARSLGFESRGTPSVPVIRPRIGSKVTRRCYA